MYLFRSSDCLLNDQNKQSQIGREKADQMIALKTCLQNRDTKRHQLSLTN